MDLRFETIQYFLKQQTNKEKRAEGTPTFPGPDLASAGLYSHPPPPTHSLLITALHSFLQSVESSGEAPPGGNLWAEQAALNEVCVCKTEPSTPAPPDPG